MLTDWPEHATAYSGLTARKQKQTVENVLGCFTSSALLVDNRKLLIIFEIIRLELLA